MEEPFLYRQIASSIRRQILNGELEPGARLLPVREMSARWNCTIGTIQRAYQELTHQGLIISRAGQGTHVVDKLPALDESPLRRAELIHRAESFLLEVLNAGYTPNEVEESVRSALDRWRVVELESNAPTAQEVRFAGSHDPAVTWIGGHFQEIAPGYTFQIGFTGSLKGLFALADGEVEIAGCHLWDAESESYNLPFVQRLLPGVRVGLVTLAHRSLGLIVAPGNPARLKGLPDLGRPGLRFANRQPGSGTRVWLDAQLHRIGLPTDRIQGYGTEYKTHFDIARQVSENEADTGLGLEFAAHSYGMDFLPLTQEEYDLAIPESQLKHPPIQALIDWLQHERGKKVISKLPGYDTACTGKLVSVG